MIWIDRYNSWFKLIIMMILLIVWFNGVYYNEVALDLALFWIVSILLLIFIDLRFLSKCTTWNWYNCHPHFQQVFSALMQDRSSFIYFRFFRSPSVVHRDGKIRKISSFLLLINTLGRTFTIELVYPFVSKESQRIHT